MAARIDSSTSFWTSGIPLRRRGICGTCTRAGSLTYPFPTQSAMLFRRRVLPRSTDGFRTQAGSLFACPARVISSTSRWLMGLSYLRYALRISADPRRLLEQESERLHLSSQFRFLLEVFVPETANLATKKPLSA